MYAGAHAYLPDEVTEISGGGCHRASNRLLRCLLEIIHKARQRTKNTPAVTLTAIISLNKKLRPNQYTRATIRRSHTHRFKPGILVGKEVEIPFLVVVVAPVIDEGGIEV
jgi:hypothetical protein